MESENREISQEQRLGDLETNARNIERQIRQTGQKVLATAIIISLLLGSTAGAVFGFIAAKLGKKPFPQIVQDLKSGKISQDGESLKTANLDNAAEEQSVIGTVQKASPAVVSIVITKDVPLMQNFNPFFNDPFFNPFGYRQQEPTEPQTEKREIGGGSGFIIDPNGYIVTNRHVVEDAQADYTVVMNDGKKLSAKVLARDTLNDMAIIKVDEKNLPTIEIGDSDNLKIGQTIVAIGNSLGEFRNTVSKGIISGLKRNVSAGDGGGSSEKLEEVIQTDAAINPGNSGGPLLDLSGKVVGINVAMAQNAQSIGFAIPINQVKKALQSVQKTGKFSRSFLGVRYRAINQQLASQNNLPFDYGVLITKGASNSNQLAVLPGSPADKAGLLENDIILEIDGKKIDQNIDLAKIIGNKNVGDKVNLKVWSRGETKNVTVTLTEANQ